MRVYDWSQEDDLIQFNFYFSCVARLSTVLNNGVLPAGYYARLEPHFGKNLLVADFIDDGEDDDRGGKRPPPAAGIHATDTPPRVGITGSLYPTAGRRPNTVVVRRSDEDRVVAMIDVAIAAYKDRPDHVTAFARKIAAALAHGVNVLVLDPLPPTRHTPGGLHPAIAAELRAEFPATEEQPAGTSAAYLSYAVNSWDIQSYLTYLAVGDPVPDVPLFLTDEEYVNVPLAAVYRESVEGMPRIDRERLLS